MFSECKKKEAEENLMLCSSRLVHAIREKNMTMGAKELALLTFASAYWGAIFEDIEQEERCEQSKKIEELEALLKKLEGN